MQSRNLHHHPLLFLLSTFITLTNSLAPPPTCPPGTYRTHDQTCIPCEPGHYCLDSRLKECPAGRYGSSPSIASPSCEGPCRVGFWCGTGSITPSEHACPTTGLFFCPEGTTKGPIEMKKGHYSNQRKENVLCTPGHYCIEGRKIPCPAGRWGSSSGLTESGCDGPCSPGTLCYCCFFLYIFLLSSLLTRSVPPPLPLFLSSSLPLFLSSSHSFFLLSPGYVCGVGEILPAPTKCGSSTKICPVGSTTSAPVHEGYYSIGGNDENTRISEIRCGPGFWCANGTKRECAPGVYGTKFGHTSSECDAPCPEGFFCPAGTVSPIPCGRVDQYCPIGSFIPTPVEKGYHTTREDVSLPILRAERVG